MGLVSLCATASAQFTTVAPFTGSNQEGFETQNTSNNAFPTCVEDRVFQDEADLCSSSAAAHITGGWGFGCSMSPQSGSRLFGATGGAAVFTFDSYAQRFGGYFGTNNPSASDGTIKFFDEAGTLLHSDLLTVPNNCTWTWHGWDFGGAFVKRIEVKSNYSSGGYMLMDALQAEIVPVTLADPFCTCDVGSSPAPCGNQGAVGNGCANSFDPGGATLMGMGLASVSASTFVLEGKNVVPNLETIFFQGDVNLNGGMGLIFGDGVRCVGGNLKRLEVVFADTVGESRSASNLATVNGNTISPGDIKLYQLWYRDTTSGPCSSMFNATNALRVTWLP